MKLFLTTFLFTFSLFSQTLYLLPDEYNNVIRYLTQEIEKAEKTILVLTDEFNNYELKKSLLQAAKRDIKIKLISAQNDQKSHLALYKNIETYIFLPIQSPIENGKIAITLIIIDNKLTCKFSSALKTAQMKHNTDIFTCKDDKEFTTAIENSISPLIKRSRLYLEN